MPTKQQPAETNWTISPRNTQEFVSEIRAEANGVTQPLAQLLEDLDRAMKHDAAAIPEIKKQLNERHLEICKVAGQAQKRVLNFEEEMGPEINRWPAILDQEERAAKEEQTTLIREHRAALEQSQLRIESVQRRRNSLYADYQSSVQLLQAMSNELLQIIARSAEAI